MARNYAALPYDYIEEMSILSDAEFGRLCRALLLYSRGDAVPELQGSERVLWARVRLQEDRYKESYDEAVRSRSEAGKRGAKKRWGQGQGRAIETGGGDSRTIAEYGKNSDANNAIAEHGRAIAGDGKNGYTETETKIETDNTPPNGGMYNTRTQFVPPTLDEVRAYKSEIGSPVDPRDFLDFYEAKGWMVGKSKMKNWKAAFRRAGSWDKYNQKPSSAAPSLGDVAPTPSNIEQMKRLYNRLKEGEHEEQ